MELVNIKNQEPIINTNNGIVFNNQKDISLQAQYHLDELELNKKIVNTMIFLIIIGVLAIVFGLVMSYFGVTTVSTLSCASGIVLDISSGIVFWLINKTTSNKYAYFNRLSLSDERDKYIEILERQPNIKFQEKMLKKLIDTHCDCIKDLNRENDNE